MESYYGASRLFLVRLWTQAGRDGQTQWQGKLQHVVSGEVHPFHDWSTLIALLERTLSGSLDKLLVHDEAAGPDIWTSSEKEG